MRKSEKSIPTGKRELTTPKRGMRRDKKIFSTRTSAFLIRWQWVPILISAPLFALPSLWPVIPLFVIPAVWLAIWLAGEDPLPRTPLNMPILIIAIMILVSTWATYDLKISIGYIAGAVLGLGAFFLAARYTETSKGWWYCFFFYAGINSILAAVVSLMVQWPQKIGLLAPITSHLISPVIALPNLSESPHPNTIPAFLLGIIPLQIVFVTSTIFHRKRWAAIMGSKPATALIIILVVLTLACSFMLLLSQSRGGYIAFIVACLFLLLAVLTPRIRWLLLGGMSLATIVVALLWQRGFLAPVQESLGNSLSDVPGLSVDSLQTRVEIWSRAIYGIQDFSYTGMGMNTFGHAMPVLYPLFTVSPELDTLNAHNTYLQAALDLGIPGLIAFLGVHIGTLWVLITTWKTVNKWQDKPQVWKGLSSLFESRFLTKRIVLGLGGSLIACLIFGLTESIGLGVYLLNWILIGLIVGLFQQIQSTQQNQASLNGAGDGKEKRRA